MWRWPSCRSRSCVMAETLIAAGILVLLGFGFLLRPRKVLAGDMDAPMHLERSRAKSEAEMAAAETDVLPEAEAGEAAALVGHFRELATDEQPIVPTVRKRHVYRGPTARQLEVMRRRLLAPIREFQADPLAAPIPDLHLTAEPVLFGAAVEDWFSGSVPFIAPAGEPKPLPALDFTGEWDAAIFARSGGAR